MCVLLHFFNIVFHLSNRLSRADEFFVIFMHLQRCIFSDTTASRSSNSPAKQQK